MIAPNYWVDRKTGNDYFLTVQYFENGSAGHSQPRGPDEHSAARAQPERPHHPRKRRATGPHPNAHRGGPLPDPENHGCLRDSPGEDLGQDRGRHPRALLQKRQYPSKRAGQPARHGAGHDRVVPELSPPGSHLAALLLYLILVAQFRSFKDPLLIMLAIPMGFIGVLVILPLTATTLNVMSLMGVLMLVGIAASNSILIVEFAHRLEEQGSPLRTP